MKFEQLKISYIAQRENYEIDELVTIYVQEEWIVKGRNAHLTVAPQS